MKLLEGKVALITGAARGIGKAIALKFASEGANIAFTDLVIDENGKATEAEIAALGVKVKGYASNAANFEETEKVVNQVKEDFGSVDILVNNAGITKDGLMINGATQISQDIYFDTTQFQNGVDFPITVGEGQIFVLGDNRPEASDSRIYGCINVKDVKGKAIAVIRTRGL